MIHLDAGVRAEQGEAFARIGRVHEVAYTEEGEGFRAEPYVHVSSKPATYFMSRYSLRLIGHGFGVDDKVKEEHGEQVCSIASAHVSNEQQHDDGLEAILCNGPETGVSVLSYLVLRRSGNSRQHISGCASV